MMTIVLDVEFTGLSFARNTDKDLGDLAGIYTTNHKHLSLKRSRDSNNMFAEWTPIAKMMKYETFETAEDSSQVIVGNVFIGVSLMILAAFLTILFYWAYNKEKHLFITLLCGLFFLYTIKVVILVASLRDKINKTVFRLYIGSTAFMSLFSLFLLVFFAVKTSKRLGSSTSSPAPYYSPAPIVKEDPFTSP